MQLVLENNLKLFSLVRQGLHPEIENSTEFFCYEAWSLTIDDVVSSIEPKDLHRIIMAICVNAKAIINNKRHGELNADQWKNIQLSLTLLVDRLINLRDKESVYLNCDKPPKIFFSAYRDVCEAYVNSIMRKYEESVNV